jgi:GDP-L-fucose synthase
MPYANGKVLEPIAIMNKSDKIYVAGHRGLVGSAIVRNLEKNGYDNFILRTSKELNLTRQVDVETFFATQKPDYVFLAAAKVGGIRANDVYPAEFIRDNLLIQANIIDAAYRNGTKKLLFLGSSCIYPKFAPQPMKEEHLLSGELEPTNEWYAIAKIAGIKMCQAYKKQYGFNAISLMPTNLYGPGDNFNFENAHVMPALIRKIHDAKLNQLPEVEVWGTGTAKREFLHVDDLADASVFLMNNYNEMQFVNVGTGDDVTIRQLAESVQKAVDYSCILKFDTSKPDGTPRKLLDVSKLKQLGWEAKIGLTDGIKTTYEWFLEHFADIRV